MIVSIAQPAYLPWPGYFDRMRRSDLAVVLDHVPLERRGFTHRNRIRGPRGPQWLTVPVRKKGHFHAPIHRLAIADPEGAWRRKHRERLRHAYADTPFFRQYFPLIEPWYEKRWERLAALLDQTTAMLRAILDIHTPLVHSHRLEVEGRKGALILAICRRLGATTYLSGPFGRDYLDEAAFQRHGIRVVYHDYVPPVYAQGDHSFCPNLSVLDLLFHHGPAARDILAGCGAATQTT